MLKGENVYTLLKKAEEILKLKGISEPKSDAEVLLSFVLQIKRSKLPIIREQKPTVKHISQYKKYIFRRSKREPVAYITGSVGFMDFEFKISKNVLIPRSETELLIEAALMLAAKEHKKSVLDLCTGSGCIAVSLAKLGNFKNVTASDISKGALDIAKLNARTNAANINFIESNIFNDIGDKKFDIVISNPPYISETEYNSLEPEIGYEPKIALTAKDDGLFFYKEIVSKSSHYLNNDGFIIVELNANKSDEIKQIFLDNLYIDVEIINDYAGLPRILKAKIDNQYLN
ncbi:MAG: peptide chain release factor N(5)-glutamine methyltransferase [Endomicrobium sp.]|jgi:release factor glutamine methyltransferase|nr:peptide chain release factor N(5)-glutamine methyltransferase [Endomicrobium sp.]